MDCFISSAKDVIQIDIVGVPVLSDAFEVLVRKIRFIKVSTD